MSPDERLTKVERDVTRDGRLIAAIGGFLLAVVVALLVVGPRTQRRIDTEALKSLMRAIYVVRTPPPDTSDATRTREYTERYEQWFKDVYYDQNL